MPITHLSVRFEGRVQGVGFRVNVADIATSYDVSGRVCNVLDGTVDLQAEGSEEELLRFRAAIGQRLERFIVDAYERWSVVPQGTWSEFAIGADLER
jgi:acylphosphatase